MESGPALLRSLYVLATGNERLTLQDHNDWLVEKMTTSVVEGARRAAAEGETRYSRWLSPDKLGLAKGVRERLYLLGYEVEVHHDSIVVVIVRPRDEPAE